MKIMEGDVVGVRINPPIVEIVDAEKHQNYKTPIVVKNISNLSKRIRFHDPVSDKFKLHVDNPEKPIAPGLELTAEIEYCSDVSEDAHDRVILSVDDDIIEIPLYAYVPTPLLDLEGPVDFGMVVSNSHVLSQEVPLVNHGSRAGEFAIAYDGNHPIVISPQAGRLAPKTIQMIKVELVTEKPCLIDDVATVTLEGMQETKLSLKALIVEQKLKVLSEDDGADLRCVEFGPAYYGTDRIEPAFLYNDGPETIKWVAVLEEGADGEEAGTDLTKSTAAMLATCPMERIRGRAYDILTSLITVFPNQGTVGPYEKVPVNFRFSPRFNCSKVGWEATEKPPPRQDFALFMKFEIVGSNESFLAENHNSNKKVEVAVTGTAVPVLVNIQPSHTFDFGEIECGSHTSALCTLTNESALLPLNIECRKVAHFNVVPGRANIKPGRSQDIMISFQPNQAGRFGPIQLIDVIGRVWVGGTDEMDSKERTYAASPGFRLLLRSFQNIPLQLLGTSFAAAKFREPRLNTGLTPAITNETGRFVDVTFENMAQIRDQIRPCNANVAQSKLHSQHLPTNKRALVAFPNDRARSVRPSCQDYETPYTRAPRHTYVDPDYAFTEQQQAERRRHREKYTHFIRNSHAERERKFRTGEYLKTDNPTDLGMKPASGIKPPYLSQHEILSPSTAAAAEATRPLNDRQRLLTTRQLANQERQATTRPVTDGLNAVPVTGVEKHDCSRILTPQDLYKIVIGPPTIDFGEVCLRSSNTKQLHIVNNLRQFIHVQVTINCKELRQTSPLSQVVPPESKAQLTLVFESTTGGKFQRSITYSVNQQHESHVLVLAEVVPVALDISSTSLELVSEAGLPADAGYRSIVTLYNNRNHAADFTWSPILTDRGTAFSIRPATGTVEAFKDLKCEVVFHPSYFAPLDGEFRLQVHNGNTIKLSCVAKLGVTNVRFVERRILFGSVPLHMRTTRTALLHNCGHNHAMFYVINSTPFPGMSVSPIHGIVPVGGNAELKITLEPSAVVKFDTWIQVNIRGWKTIDLRMGGTVEPPEVDIDVKSFRFGGVYRDSSVALPFNLVNLTNTRVRAHFDLARYTDFSLTFPDDHFNVDDDNADEDGSSHNTYNAEVPGNGKLSCVLTFHPSAVAAYDFTMPVLINRTGAPSPTPSTFPPTPVPSERHIITPRPIMISIATPRRRVLATALRPPLAVSAHTLKFTLPVSYMEMRVPDNAGGDSKKLELSNTSERCLKWKLDVPACKELLNETTTFVFLKQGGAEFNNLREVCGKLSPGETYTITVVFCPRAVGSYVYKIPILLDDDTDRPYRYLTLDAFLQQPSLTFDPLALVLTPVPLSTAVFAEFTVIANGYYSKTNLTVDIPDAEADDGSTVSCFQLEFPNGSEVIPNTNTSFSTKLSQMIPCVLTFSSGKPLSVTVDLTFSDNQGKKSVIPVTATADNCLLTVYPFLAAHRNDHQIVCEQDKTAQRTGHNRVGEAVLLPCVSSHRPSTRGSTSATSSHFSATSSTFDESTNSVSGDSDELGAQSSRDGAQPAIAQYSDTASHQRSQHMKATHDVASTHKKPMADGDDDEEAAKRDLASRSLGSAVFPFESSMESHFHQEILTAVQRWFSAYGWPGGPFPIQVPHSLRSLVSRVPYDDDGGARPTLSVTNAANKGGSPRGGDGGGDMGGKDAVKTIYDMLQHMCGRIVPGIAINQPLPRDPAERVLQLHWQHSTLLTFLRGQGASVSAIRPEFLLTPRDYKIWVRVCERDARKEAGGRASRDEESREEESGWATTLSIEEELFESVSKRAWTDLLLQLFKVLVLSRVSYSQYKSMKSVDKSLPLPTVNPDPLASNIYSVGERIVLAWLNHNYEHQRHEIWGSVGPANSHQWKGGVPPSRWVVNFDYDLLDGLVLAATLAAYCPWLIADCLVEMYTSPSSPEQCLHNTLILVRAMRNAGICYDIQATDITDPNPVNLLFLCVYLYQNLPSYTPKSTIEFVGALHSTVHRQVRISNPSGRLLRYRATISGRDADDFSLPKGPDITVPHRGHCNLDVHFTSRLLRPAEAFLTLVGQRDPGQEGLRAASRVATAVGSTLVFSMKTAIDDIHPAAVVRVATPCYELLKVKVPVVNVFEEAGDFRIVLVESSDAPSSPLHIGHTGAARKRLKSLSSRIRSVKSKTDHGQPKELSPPPTPPQEERVVPLDLQTTNNSTIPAPTAGAGTDNAGGGTSSQYLPTFFCHSQSVTLEPGKLTHVEIDYLPFNTGRKFCSLLLVNEQVGELIYAIEADAALPLPSPLPHNTGSPHSVRISSAAAAERDDAGGGDVVYWKCENNATLREKLIIPVTNESKEQALREAAKQRMSHKEQERRNLTGTMKSGSVTAAIASMGNLLDDENACLYYDNQLSHPASAPPRPRGVVFHVQTTSDWFQVPAVVTIPSPMTFGPPPATELAPRAGPNDRQDDGTFDLEVCFTPRGPGHYPCDIVLRSANDVRVYRVECVVNPPGVNARFDFRTPAHQSITQNIPIQNPSNHDWDLECTIDGVDFHGPLHMTAKAMQTTYYPLMFKPHSECDVTGKLTIINKPDGTEHVFSLHGVGESPLPVDHLHVECRCRDMVKRTVPVPNFSPHKLTYHVYSDVPYVDGASRINVLSGKTAEYEFSLSPWQRGTVKGVLMFVAEGGADAASASDSSGDDDHDYDSRASKTPSYLQPRKPAAHADTPFSGYRVWYSVEVNVTPGDPVGVIKMESAAQKHVTYDIPIQNPSKQEIVFDVQIVGDALSGDSSFKLMPGIPGVLRVNYSPTTVGTSEGSIVVCSAQTGEFWYKCDMTAITPPPTHLKMMECNLGGWSRQPITVENPTDDYMEVDVTVDNEVNFSVDLPVTSSTGDDATTHGRAGHSSLWVAPRSTCDVMLQFIPSSLGLAGHRAKLSFRSKELGEVTYFVSGRGLAPVTMEPVSVSASVGSNTSLILPFRNPTDVNVLVDVRLTDDEVTLNSISGSVLRKSITIDSAFCILLKHMSNIKLEPRKAIDIPFTFSPDVMKKHQATLSVAVRREDGLPWPEEYDDDEDNQAADTRPSDADASLRPLSRTDEGRVKAIRWVFPVHGIPEVRSTVGSEAVLQCQARSRIEERLEVTLTGAVPSSSSAPHNQNDNHELVRLRAVTPMQERRRPSSASPHPAAVADGVIVEGRSIAEEFSYELKYPSAEARQQIEQALAVTLVRKERDPHSGLVVLVFNLVFAPFRPISHVVQLTVTSATGGVWSFPLSIQASEPPPDDIIPIEAASLGKASTVSFTMYSQARHATPFEAFFMSGSDSEFSVEPAGGELQPHGTAGTRIILTFTPKMYGKRYKARLVVQTLDMQWTYDVHGVTPEYRVPKNISSQILSRAPVVAQRSRPINHVRRNLKLTATAVSSPIKGLPLVNRTIQPPATTTK